MELVDKLLQRTSEMIDSHSANVVAFSGGVDSSLVAALVHRAFTNYVTEDTNTQDVISQQQQYQTKLKQSNYIVSNQTKSKEGGSVQAVLGISPAVPQTQIQMARNVAQTIGISLMELVDKLLQRTSEMIDSHSANVVAFSGGVDSSLVAALVHRAFTNYVTEDTNTQDVISQQQQYQTKLKQSNYIVSNQTKSKEGGSVQAVLGISPAVPQTQIQMARNVAQTIGISLKEVNTTEGDDETYVKNDGYACFVCKTHLYSTLESVANEVMKQEQNVILYNGTNADDKLDSTRVGLNAANNFQVQSPLDRITKDQVRQAAKYLGLPNWNAAASPCLRSRLAMGVLATEHHLLAVEKAESFIRKVLQLDETANARVRMLAGSKAVVELDNSIIYPEIERVLQDNLFEEKCRNEWGFQSFGGVRAFKTGSVAAAAKTSLATAAE